MTKLLDPKVFNQTKLLDHGYVRLIEGWGSDRRIVEAARMSTDKGFEGWGTAEKPGDEKLLRYLYKNRHDTPFEMGGLIIEVQAPIFVFREWHRHRTQCLHPDTLIHFDAPKSRSNRHSVYKMRIEDIWKKWQPTTRSVRPERQTNALFPRSRIQAMQLRRLNEEGKEFEHTRIVDVIRGEPKPMVRVTVASGRSVTLTRAHRVMTNLGWKTLDEALQAKALLTLEGTTRAKAERWEVPFNAEHEEWLPVLGWGGLYEVSDQGRVRRGGCAPKKPTPAANGYDVVSLSRNGETSVRHVHVLVLEAFVGLCPPGMEARHKNNNRADARLSNLAWGTPKENAADRVTSDRQQRLVPVFEEVAEVEEVGSFPTYDLTVEGPWHNFVADGFVVHNSYNEMSARYTPLPNLNYIPTIERLLINSKGSNKQAGTIDGAAQLDREGARWFQKELKVSYAAAQKLYEKALKRGVPKELARVHLPVGRYSRMRASANLRNWLAFVTLRSAPSAQWEIRQYSNAVLPLLAKRFPRTLKLFAEGRL